MIKESVKSASTIEDAKAAALLELGLTEDDVYNIEVLQMPQKRHSVFSAESLPR